MDGDRRLIVQAEFNFRGGNNDELVFNKGDFITVTQKEEGGWWEGTLSDRTGWFPSNYVKEYKGPSPASGPEPILNPIELLEHRNIVLKDFVETEESHVAELKGLLENYLIPMKSTDILNDQEYSQLIGNFKLLVETHESFLDEIKDGNARIGKIFLARAGVLKKVHEAYCTTHPKAILILDKYKEKLEEFMEKQGASSPGILVLTAGLSKPFRRLQQYSSVLKELERHMDIDHVDRGDTQRSIVVYNDLCTLCTSVRRQKELEIQIMTGPIRGWQEKTLVALGEIVHMDLIHLIADGKDRYMVLFPQLILILSVSPRMSAFIFEDKIQVFGLKVNRLDDPEMFEIVTTTEEKITIKCKNSSEVDKWLEHLDSGEHNGILSQQFQHKRSLSFNHYLSYNQFQNREKQKSIYQKPSEKINSVENEKRVKWTIANLKSISPLRPLLLTKAEGPSRIGSNVSKYSISRLTYDEDSLVLKVIESYCFANKKKTVESNKIDLSYDGKDPTMARLCSLVKQIQKDIVSIQAQINEERSSRIQLQQLVVNHLKSIGKTNNV